MQIRNLQKDQPTTHHIIHMHPQTRAQVWQGYIVHFDISQIIPTALKNQFKKVKDTISLLICISVLVQRALCSEYLFLHLLQNKYEAAS